MAKEMNYFIGKLINYDCWVCILAYSTLLSQVLAMEFSGSTACILITLSDLDADFGHLTLNHLIVIIIL